MLTDDLQAADKHVELIRNALTGLSKRLGTPPSAALAQDTSLKEKRLVISYLPLKSNNLYSTEMVMVPGSGKSPDSSFFLFYTYTTCKLYKKTSKMQNIVYDI